MPKTNSLLKRLSRWTCDQLVGDVPKDVALCEFDCGRGQCTLGEWESCERRRASAAGELMPEEKPAETLKAD
jgi:hypothetical protein